MRQLDSFDFDVIILGTGIAGTMLGTILARHGKSVLLIDSGVHPRFAVGESTIPQTSQLISLLSRDYDVPELWYLGLGSPGDLRRYVSTNCGVKRFFGFAYHHFGQEHNVAEAHQFGNIWRVENHLFRQDIDAYLLALAIRYGAHAVQGTRVDSVDIDDASVQVVAGGTQYRAKYVVDGTGFRSVLAEKYGLREKPCQRVTSTRTIFTHMIDVKGFEQIVDVPFSNAWSHGTLHQIFKRGWFWVIPFNNWENAPNPLISVGVTMDDRLYPEDPNLSAEAEFNKFLQMLPSVDRQFADAKAVRPWVRTQRVQYGSTRTMGKRFSLLSHAAWFIDPLFSRGLISTVDNLRLFTRTLLDALNDGDFSEERFEHIDKEQQRAMSFADRIVRAAYTSWDDFELWNAWIRVWAIGVHAAESRLGSVLLMKQHSKEILIKDPVSTPFEPPGYKEFFNAMYRVIEQYDDKILSVEQARKALWSIIERYEYSLPMPDGSANQEWAMSNPRCRDVTLGNKALHERWAARLTDAYIPADANQDVLLQSSGQS